MTLVYFVRHAIPNFNNHDDITRELSAEGLKDRKRVTEFLWDKEIDIILSSPYKRAVDTVKKFADAKRMEITLINDFRERKVGNAWLDDFDNFCQKQWENFDFKLSDGESLSEVQKRNISALQQVLKVYKGKNVVIGSHGTALSTIINYFDSSFRYNEFNKISNLMPWIVKFSFENSQCIGIQKYNLFEMDSEYINN